MEIHSNEECEKYWRDRFSQQIEECIATPWENGSDYNQEANWFRQGLTYAMMIIRWNYDGETDHKEPI